MPDVGRQRWAVASGMGLLGFVVWGVGFYAMPVFYVPLEAEFRWSRTQVTFAGALAFFLYSGSGPAVGAWIDAMGVRKVIAAGVLLFGAALTFFAFGVSTLATFYLVGGAFGVACMCVSSLPAQVLVSRWFEKNRAVVMGVVLALMALGGAVCSALAGRLIPRLGWRQTVVLFDVAVWCVALPVCLLVIREAPVRRAAAAAEAERAAESDAADGLSLRAALGTQAFYLLCGSVMLNRAAGNALLQNIVLHVNGLGHGLEFGAYVMSGLAVSNLGARLLVGAVSDRVSLRVGVILSYACVGLSVVLFLLASGRPLLFLAGVVVGLGYGGSILMMPVLTASLFGTRALGKILGLVLLASGVGSMTGTFLVGRIYDATKSYQAAFLLLLVFAVASVAAVWPIRPRHPKGEGAARPAPRGGALNLAPEKNE